MATVLAEWRHCPLVELSDLERNCHTWKQGHRRRIAPTEGDRVLVIDDTCNSGRTIKQVRERLTHVTAHVTYGALYYSDDGLPHLDYGGRRLTTPVHEFEWNLMRTCLAQQWLVDMDGVLCEDWGKCDIGKWQGPYEGFLEAAPPLYLPCYRLLGIVTARMEKYREVTDRWLDKHGVARKRLVMSPAKDEHERERIGHAKYKADAYLSYGDRATLFVESSLKQAGEIAKLTRKPVLSIEGMQMFNGTEPDPWHD